MDYTTRKRADLAKTGHALPDGSYPIVTRRDLANAITSYGRATNKAKVKRHIIKHAKALSATHLLPDTWK